MAVNVKCFECYKCSNFSLKILFHILFLINKTLLCSNIGLYCTYHIFDAYPEQIQDLFLNKTSN